MEEYEAKADPVAHQATCAGFAAGGWGRPAHTFRFAADEIRPLLAPG